MGVSSPCSLASEALLNKRWVVRWWFYGTLQAYRKLSTFESIGHRNRNLGLRFLDNTTTRTNLTFSHLRKELQFVNAPSLLQMANWKGSHQYI
ncbi:hypothetical protein CDAR_56121 [Caerostris darwini]|uniref:Uncharacterized protein n=1 Tax=Caerostris darwini TaxID=1538125 RepID=A0AAV4RN75_9ARAC|nr:hypothetical protein CDAR_56121 [Caerostris darwini]